MTVSTVYTDTRGRSKPYAITVRRGEFVEFHRYPTPRDAERERERLIAEGAEPA